MKERHRFRLLSCFGELLHACTSALLISAFPLWRKRWVGFSFLAFSQVRVCGQLAGHDIIFFSRRVCWKREIKLTEFLCFLSVACFLSSAWWLRIMTMFCFTLLVLNAKNLPPLDTNGTWYVLHDAVRDRLQRRCFLSADNNSNLFNIFWLPVHRAFEYNPPRMSTFFF